MTQLNLNMDPQEALDNINAHDHASALGNQISTAGIVDNAVTVSKLTDGAVTTGKIANNAVTTEKVADGAITAGKIAAGVLANSGVVGLTDYIGKGAKIKPNAGLSVAVEPMEASIAGAYQQTSADINITLDARKASLIYAQKGEGGVPVLGKVDAVYPEADDNTVLRYTFSEVGNPQDTSGNENHITTMVGCTRVDGWADFAKKGDGSTGYMVSGATTGFPTGAQERQVDILFTPLSVSQAFTAIFSYGNGSAQRYSFGLGLYNGRLKFNNDNDVLNTGFDVEVGTTYFISLLYNGEILKMYVNGNVIFSGAVNCATTTTVMYIFSRVQGDGTRTDGVIHYLELRNKCRTSAQIAQIANKLCLPFRYDVPQSPIPLMTANNSQGCITSASSEYNSTYAAYTAFRKCTVSGDYGWMASTNTGWIQLQIPNSFTPKWIELRCTASFGDRMPKDFTIKGSNDGINWITILTVTGAIGWQANEIRRFNIPIPNNSCTYLRLDCTAVNGGSYIFINDLDFGTDDVSYSDIREILPADSISLGRVRTGSIEINEIRMDYQDGRREGATGGNRKVFLGWKYFTGGDTLGWEEPFDTLSVKRTYKYAEDATGRNRCDVESRFDSGTNYGIMPHPIASKNNRIYCGAGGVVYLNGSWKSLGYMGCYAEVIE